MNGFAETAEPGNSKAGSSSGAISRLVLTVILIVTCVLSACVIFGFFKIPSANVRFGLDTELHYAAQHNDVAEQKKLLMVTGQSRWTLTEAPG